MARQSGHTGGVAKRRRPLLFRLLRGPVYLYRLHCGWLLGHRFVLLTHTGRRSGEPHQTVLEVVEYTSRTPTVVVMSGFGANSDWLRNLEAGGPSSMTISTRAYPVSHRLLETEEAMEAFAGYERRNRFVEPIVRRVLTRLLGWPYSGTVDNRRKLVEQLPLIALEPKTPSS